jgi:hypothetical protein
MQIQRYAGTREGGRACTVIVTRGTVYAGSHAAPGARLPGMRTITLGETGEHLNRIGPGVYMTLEGEKVTSEAEGAP